MVALLRRLAATPLVARNWKAVVLAALIIAMLLFAPGTERKFIYTDF